jgi:hypothetical protein
MTGVNPLRPSNDNTRYDAPARDRSPEATTLASITTRTNFMVILYAVSPGESIYSEHLVYAQHGRELMGVKANQGAAGVDGMSIETFPEFARHHWERIRSAPEEGTYRPAAVPRVMIPKASGGQRPLGTMAMESRCAEHAATMG